MDKEISFAAHEADMARQERTIRRLWVLVIIETVTAAIFLRWMKWRGEK